MRGTAASHKVLSSELGIKGLSCSGHKKGQNGITGTGRQSSGQPKAKTQVRDNVC